MGSCYLLGLPRPLRLKWDVSVRTFYVNGKAPYVFLICTSASFGSEQSEHNISVLQLSQSLKSNTWTWMKSKPLIFRLLPWVCFQAITEAVSILGAIPPLSNVYGVGIRTPRKIRKASWMAIQKEPERFLSRTLQQGKRAAQYYKS